MTYAEKVTDFLSQRKIAIAGVSRKPQTEVGNAIYKKFKEAGYTVFPINPNAEYVEGDRCYKNLSETPEKADAVFIAANPAAAPEIIKQCLDNGITRVWFHKGLGNGSYNKEAAQYGETNGLTVIHNGCPMMFIKGADPFHRFVGFVKKILGRLEK
ncbi:MAG: CoA-binding domain protein [Ignavibacteria bacterium]|nr:MAG: CoA-binding domain protein [Ignavibacteria bacterium]KAF0158912.1 MAG: CoA-binding domain protein [Ignavibacteria bacterium]